MHQRDRRSRLPQAETVPHMRPCLALPLTALLAAAATPALADAISYTGHLGKLQIILEITTAGGDTPQVGRYAYLSKGVDIPLHVTADGAGLRLREESPCTEALCRTAGGDLATEAPIGAEWQLSGVAGDQQLDGTWRDLKSGKSFKIDLTRAGRRPQGDGSYDPFEALTGFALEGGAAATPKYDVMKMDYPFKRGEATAFGDGVIRMDIDPRNGLDYPVIVSLPGGDPTALNAYLARQRVQAEMPAFSCGATAYLGLGWSGSPSDGSDGFEGNWSIQLEHLSPRLMGFSESGSYFCGGAYPNNFTEERLLDARTGTAIVAEHLLAGWRDDAPTPELVAYVNEHRDRSDSERETDCGLNDLVATNLGVYFRQHSLVFPLKGLPHVIFACTDDILEIPLKDARPLLTDAGAAYFSEYD